MNKTLKILYLTREMYPNNRALLSELWNNELSKRGHKITWVMQPEKASDYTKVTKWGESRLYLVRNSKRNNLYSKFISSIYRFSDKYYTIYEILNNEEFDIIQVRNGIFESFIAMYFAKKKNIVFSFHLSSMHGYHDKEIYSKEFKGFILFLKNFFRLFIPMFYTYIIKHANIFQPISSSMEKILSRNGIFAEKTLPVPLSASTKFYKYDIINKSKVPKYDTIVYLGTIRKSRDFDFMVKIFDKSKSIFPDLKLLIIGDDELRKKSYKDTYPELNRYKDDVTITGFVSYNEVPKFFSKNMIGLSSIPPFRKFLVSTPSKIVDYISLGIPIVANREILFQKKILKQSKGGILVDYKLEQYIKAISWLINNPSKSRIIGKRGKSWILKNHNYEILAKKLETHYLDIMKV